MQSTLEMTHDQWLEERRKGLGGSDAAAILGMNPYKSPLAVYMDKLGLAPEIEDNEAMRQGRDLEQYVAERFCEATGKKVRRCNRILQHPDHPWMLANVDRMIVGEKAGLECKTTSVYNKTEFARGDVPPVYYWQCLAYMAVTGYPTWYLAVLVLNRDFHTFEITRNDEHIALLTDRARDFWRDHILAGVPPLPEGTDEDDDLVAMLPASHSAEDVADLQDVEDDIILMQTLKGEADEMERRAKAIRQRLILRLDGAQTGRTDRWEIRYREQTSARIDAAKLRADRPDIADEYTKLTTSRVLRVKEVKP